MHTGTFIKAIRLTTCTAILTLGSMATVDAAQAPAGREAIIASGTCIAKYATLLEDTSMSAAEVGQKVAARCAKQISRSAQAAAHFSGKPETFETTLKYTREELTAGTVQRARANSAQRLASL